MTNEGTLHLAERIAAIEARGLGHLRATARRESVDQGLATAFAAALPVPALAFLAGWFVPLRWDVVGIAALAVPAAGFGIAYAQSLRQQKIGRSAALTLFDRELALKDRITTTDEFLRDPRGGGFRAAAVQEASPWIERAATTAVAQPSRPLTAARRRYILLGVSALLLATSAVEQRFVPAGGRNPGIAAALAAVGIAAPLSQADQRALLEADGKQRTAGGNDVRAAARGIGAGEAGQQTDGGGRDRGGLGGSQPTSGWDKPGANASGSGSQSAPQSGAAQQAKAGAQGAANRDPSVTDQDGRQGAAGHIDADRSAAADGQAGQQRGAAPQNSAAAGNQAPSPSPLGSQQRPPSEQSGKGGQPGQQNRSQQGAQDQSQPGEGKGQGRDGQRSGQDALKRANGLAAMLLAVPMRDRLGGTPNAGPVSSLPRQAPPHPGASGATSAVDRGVATGDIGRITHRPVSPQEQQLLQRYFRPSGRTAESGGRR